MASIFFMGILRAGPAWEKDSTGARLSRTRRDTRFRFANSSYIITRARPPRAWQTFDHAGIPGHPGSAPVTVEIVDTLARVAPAEWNRLAGDDPFLSHEFLSALHETGCASPETGWTPQYVLLREDGALSAALPLYLKDHSYGEYVFDWAWADAYYRNGLAYYPKLLSAVPFTPVQGSRLLASTRGASASSPRRSPWERRSRCRPCISCSRRPGRPSACRRTG